jgi:superoxide dismutase, Cu-Zn family
MRKLVFGFALAGLICSQASEAKKGYKIEIKDLKGQVVGTGVLSTASPKGVQLDLTITNLPPGNHAFHIHQKPLCEASEEFDTAGLQYDPTGEMYGNATHAAHSGHSAGDPRMTVDVGADGSGRSSVVFPALTMGNDDHSVFYNNGTSIMFHAAANAKGPTRIACGVIREK